MFCSLALELREIFSSGLGGDHTSPSKVIGSRGARLGDTNGVIYYWMAALERLFATLPSFYALLRNFAV